MSNQVNNSTQSSEKSSGRLAGFVKASLSMGSRCVRIATRIGLMVPATFCVLWNHPVTTTLSAVGVVAFTAYSPTLAPLVIAIPLVILLGRAWQLTGSLFEMTSWLPNISPGAIGKSLANGYSVARTYLSSGLRSLRDAVIAGGAKGVAPLFTVYAAANRFGSALSKGVRKHIKRARHSTVVTPVPATTPRKPLTDPSVGNRLTEVEKDRGAFATGVLEPTLKTPLCQRAIMKAASRAEPKEGGEFLGTREARAEEERLAEHFNTTYEAATRSPEYQHMLNELTLRYEAEKAAEEAAEKAAEEAAEKAAKEAAEKAAEGQGPTLQDATAGEERESVASPSTTPDVANNSDSSLSGGVRDHIEGAYHATAATSVPAATFRKPLTDPSVGNRLTEVEKDRGAFATGALESALRTPLCQRAVMKEASRAESKEGGEFLGTREARAEEERLAEHFNTTYETTTRSSGYQKRMALIAMRNRTGRMAGRISPSLLAPMGVEISS
ncbi:MAG: hypothetical protein OXF02_03300 [Simkaniaceae bacterium]|nr:hypothetical protein [Simkaniaceae bacterium]